ncbi:Hpt domain-containing protein [Flammeovirga yaeyamensis]|uniref:Hpt domain-containing protein n=1 Tax=Flammeovirga yaeyamensis TaxID=367791 RepID=A0AAX1NC19_9BACT|nr:Hpt domain-containing protein [Flammeovirga yaeyamensis]QWG03845.1 Hpt domain-containing protein [Flammeovirga yaeyamensis]
MSTIQNSKMYDLTQLQALSRGDDSFVTKMIDSFLTNLNEGIEEINEAVSYNDWATIAKVAHRLKPSFQILGVNSLSEVILHLEKDYLNDNFDENSYNEIIKKFVSSSGVLKGQIQQFLHN